MQVGSVSVTRELSASQGIQQVVDGDSLSQWLKMIFLVIAAILQMKIQTIWAASRILRKLRNPARKKMGSELSEMEVDQRFVELVLSLCKGRNNRYSRMLQGIFNLFLISSTTWAFYGSDLIFLESYLALVLPLMAGSLVVVGARVLKWYEVGSVFLLSFVYGGLIFASSTSVFRIPFLARKVAFGVEVAVIIISSLVLLFDMYGDYHGSHDDLFCTTQAIWKGNRNGKQDARFLQMKKLTSDMKNSKGVGRGMRIWNVTRRRFLIDVLLYFLQCVASVILIQGEGQISSAANIVGLEVFELISVCMTFVNESLVEPTLYVTLMEHALDYDEKQKRHFSQLESCGSCGSCDAAESTSVSWER